jgi:ketosteroid isomerase-like protein
MSKVIFMSAEEAETAFYQALQRCDLEAMMSVWAEDEDIVCVHPGGVRITGFAAVRETWRQVFSSGARISVRVTGEVVSRGLLMAVHSVQEIFHLGEEGDQPAPPIIATNVYFRGAAGWHMVCHHASLLPHLDVSTDAPRAAGGNTVH